ncbi:MAG: type II toxin-antitoxin system HigB family toxin [Cyclobacteriaceae bacterium]
MLSFSPLKIRGKNPLLIAKPLTFIVINIYLYFHIKRNDLRTVHSEGFYFFNLNVHRTMVLIEFNEGEATVVWVGTHQEYETTFRNNKNTIRNWLRSHEWI